MIKKIPHVYIETHGCKINMYESAVFEKALKKQGVLITSNLKNASYYILNSCTVTAKADSEARKRLRHAKRANPHIQTVLTGCYASQLKKNQQMLEYVDFSCKNDPQDIVSIIKKEADQETFQSSPERIFADNISGKTRIYLKLQDGCKDFCSYCIIPYTRPTIKSLQADLAIDEIKRLHSLGFKEIVLGGVHLGYYGKDLDDGTNLDSLLQKISLMNNKPRIRISSIESRQVSSTIISLLKNESWLCKHLHIPLQSGSDQILNKMNRKYKTADYAKTINKIKKEVSFCCIGADVMTGFPSETENNFKQSYNLIVDLPIDYLHVFPYSERPGTKSTKMPGKLEVSLIKERAASLRKLGTVKQSAFLDQCKNLNEMVLVEKQDIDGKCSGLTSNYISTVFYSPLKNQTNQLVPVTPQNRYYMMIKQPKFLI